MSSIKIGYKSSSCETSNNCRSGGYEESCCFDEFCGAYPSHPNCGNVPPCQECDEECTDQCNGNQSCETSCAEDCINGEPACNQCLDENSANPSACF